MGHGGFVDQFDQPGQQGFPDDLSLFGRGRGGIAVDTDFGPPPPEIAELHVGRGAVGTHILAHHVVAGHGFLHSHPLGRQMQIKRSLEFVGVGHHGRLLHAVESFDAKTLIDRGTERLGGQHRFSSDQIDQRRVRAVAVDDQDFLKAVIRQTLGDAQAEGHKRLGLDVDCAREVDVVEIESEGDGGQTIM